MLPIDRATRRRALCAVLVLALLPALFLLAQRTEAPQSVASFDAGSRQSALSATRVVTSSPADLAVKAPQSGSVPLDRAPFNVRAVIEQVQNAFETRGDELVNQRATHGVRVNSHGITLNARKWHADAPAAKPDDAEARVASRKVAAPRESADLLLKTRYVGRSDTTAWDDVLPEVAKDGHVTWERPDHVEHLRGGKQGAEQSWEFAAEPVGQGDLRVLVAVSGLAYVGTSEGGLHFADASGLGFRYGHATWVDANGVRTKVAAHYDADAIELDVPQSVVESSAYPAVLDPVIGPEFGLDEPIVSPDFLAQLTPSVAFNGTHYLVVWQDRRSSTYDLIGTRVTKLGEVVDTSGIIITDDNAQLPEEAPTVASDGSGFLAVWRDERSTTKYELYASRVGADGVVLDRPNFKVFDGTTSNAASVASNGSGYLVTWNYVRGGSGGVFARRVSTAGEVLDPYPYITVSNTTYNEQRPSVTSNGTDYMVVWEDNRNGTGGQGIDVYASRVSAAGAVLDAAGVRVCNATGDQLYPKVASTGLAYLVVWQDYGSGDYDVYGGRLNNSGVVQGSLGGFAISATGQWERMPSVASNGTNFLVSWSDTRGDGEDVYAARVTAGGVVSDPAGIAISTGTGDQTSPSVATDKTDYFAVWEDTRTGTSDIYGGRISSGGVVGDGNGLLVSKEENDELEPTIASNGTDYAVAWQDNRSGKDYDIYATRVAANGDVLDAPALAVSTAKGNQQTPQVASNGTDYFIAWQDSRSGYYDIFGSRLTAAGLVVQPTGSPVCTTDGSQSAPSIASNGSSYLVAWDAFNGSDSDVYANIVNGAGIAQNTTGFAVSTATGSQRATTVASNGTDYLVGWGDQRADSLSDIYVSRVLANGTVVDTSGIPVSAAAGVEAFPVLASDGTDYLAVWRDHRADGVGDLYASRVTSDGTVLDPAGIAVCTATGNQFPHGLASNGDDYMLVWQDMRSGASEIYGATIAFTPTTEVTEFPIAVGGIEWGPPSAVAGDGIRYLVSYQDAESLMRINARMLGELCPGDPLGDADGDDVCGSVDNCPTTSNQNQSDLDGDAKGDKCDGCPNDAAKLLPGVCGCGVADTDADGDGNANCNDGCPNDPAKSSVGACGCGVADTDTDSDGTADCNDGCASDATKIVPGVCGCGVLDTDTDTDGTPNCNDGCPSDATKVAAGLCGCGVVDADTDADGTPNCTDGCPNDAGKLAAGLCGCGVVDTDTDTDGAPNCNDGCPSDATKVVSGVCGCGVLDTDTDSDGTPNCNDGCASDANKTRPGACGCGILDTDSDGDGTPNCTDGCPNDLEKIAAGACGCGVADTDSDGDGTPNCTDTCPNDTSKIAPGACGCGNADTDSDGDQLLDCDDGCPSDAAKQPPGACGCGVVDSDVDTDADATPDCIDPCPEDAADTCDIGQGGSAGAGMGGAQATSGGTTGSGGSTTTSGGTTGSGGAEPSTGGSTSSGGTSNASGGAAGASADGSKNDDDSGDDGGCGCRVAGAAPSSAMSTALICAGLAVFLFRRRRQALEAA